MRTVIEQTNARIKQNRIVGNHPYRGDIDYQGINWCLCTQLEARTMRIRNTYPRGEKWMRGELEPWEVDLGESLYIDPRNPGLYEI